MNLLNDIISVAKPIPLWRGGLCPTCHICGPSGNNYGTGVLQAGDKLPPEPAVSFPFAQQASFLPKTVVDSDFDACDRRRSRPCDTTNRQLSALDFALRFRLGDQTPHPWLTEIDVISGQFNSHYQTGAYFYEWSREGQIVREPVSLQRVLAIGYCEELCKIDHSCRSKSGTNLQRQMAAQPTSQIQAGTARFSPYKCSDPNCQNCKELQELQEAIRLRSPIREQ